MEKMPPICPLLSVGTANLAPCKTDRCAWFHVEYDSANDIASGACALVNIADALKVFQYRDQNKEEEFGDLSCDI